MFVNREEPSKVCQHSFLYPIVSVWSRKPCLSNICFSNFSWKNFSWQLPSSPWTSQATIPTVPFSWRWYLRWGFQSLWWVNNFLGSFPICAYASSFVSVVSHSLSPPWSIACQAHLSMEFSRQENWRRLTFSSPGDFSDPGIKPASPVSPACQADSLPLSKLLLDFLVNLSHVNICLDQPKQPRSVEEDFFLLNTLKQNCSRGVWT